MTQVGEKWPRILVCCFVFLLVYSCKKDYSGSTPDDPEYRIAFWCGSDDGCGYINVFVDGARKGQVKYYQPNGPTNCAESYVSLSIPITKGKHTLRFSSSCQSKDKEVEYEIEKECTLYKIY